MTTHKEKAEAYVRQALPELAEWQIVSSGRAGIKDGRASKPTIQLQHWLRVLGNISPKPIIEMWSTQVEVYLKDKPQENILFNLTTGQPATEVDYQAIAKILNIE